MHILLYLIHKGGMGSKHLSKGLFQVHFFSDGGSLTRGDGMLF